MTLEDKLVEKPAHGEEPEKLTRFAFSNASRPAEGFREPFTVFFNMILSALVDKADDSIQPSYVTVRAHRLTSSRIVLSGGSFFRYLRNPLFDAIKSTVASIICGCFHLILP
ncbi:hypothetical protein ACLB1N_36675 [Escherichia coli]